MTSLSSHGHRSPVASLRRRDLSCQSEKSGWLVGHRSWGCSAPALRQTSQPHQTPSANSNAARGGRLLIYRRGQVKNRIPLTPFSKGGTGPSGCRFYFHRCAILTPGGRLTSGWLFRALGAWLMFLTLPASRCPIKPASVPGEASVENRDVFTKPPWMGLRCLAQSWQPVGGSLPISVRIFTRPQNR